MKAMGTLVQSKTLKFDMSSMLKVSPMELSSPGMRPSSAAVGGGGDAASQMRLSNLVKELQEQLQAQARQILDKQKAHDRALRDLSEERTAREKQREVRCGGERSGRDSVYILLKWCIFMVHFYYQRGLTPP